MTSSPRKSGKDLPAKPLLEGMLYSASLVDAAVFLGPRWLQHDKRPVMRSLWTCNTSGTSSRRAQRQQKPAAAPKITPLQPGDVKCIDSVSDGEEMRWIRAGFKLIAQVRVPHPGGTTHGLAPFIRHLYKGSVLAVSYAEQAAH